MTKCPHCGAVARSEPSAPVRWRCAVCGGPVVPTSGEVTRSNAELPDLVRSHRARAMALGWLAGSFVLGSIAAMAMGVALLTWFASHLAGGILSAVAAVAMVLAVASLRRSRGRRREAREDLDRAWELVAGEVMAERHRDTTAPELARVMSTDVGHAEQLLSRLSARGGARVAVRDDAELTYRVDTATAIDEAPIEMEPAAPATVSPRARTRS